MTSYAVEWIPGPAFLALLLPVLIVPGFALIALAVVALAAVAGLAALAWAMLAMPYLLARSLRRRFAERRQSKEASVLTGSVPAQERRGAKSAAPGVSGLAEPVALLAGADQPPAAADPGVVGQ
jgi:membrane protein implicated in regulation of membrane protease activity